MAQPKSKHTLPDNARVVIPLWDHCNLALTVDPSGLVRQWYLVEAYRWGDDAIVRPVSEYYAMHLYAQEYPIPEPEAIPRSMVASGEIG